MGNPLPAPSGMQSSEPRSLGVEGLQLQVLPSPGLGGSTQPVSPPRAGEPLEVVLDLGHRLRSAAPWGMLSPQPDCQPTEHTRSPGFKSRKEWDQGVRLYAVRVPRL